MNETTDQIESHIRQTRADLSANLDELEQKVKSLADWRRQYAKSPGTFAAAAVGAGVLLALATNRRRPPGPRLEKAGGALDDSIGVIKGALIGLAASHAKTLLSRLLPGFEAQLPENEKPRSPPSH